MEAYLDNSATTRCSKAAADMVYKLLTEDYGNPSSLHMKGVEAENYINDAKKKIAKTLRVQEKEILFTSGGTESNNTAIIGAAMANKRAGRHIITSSVEHASVLSVMQFLEEQGFEITYLPVNHDGVISVEELKNAVREDTILVSLMHVNNEIGAVMPIEEAGAAIKEKNPAALFHVDAIQSYGKLEIRPKDHTNAPHVVSVSVDGVRAEVMLHTLEDRQIYVSAGSACSSNKPAISSTLKSIGLKPSLLDSTIRFSFCVNTTQEEIDYAVSVMAEVIPMLRRYTRR